MLEKSKASFSLKIGDETNFILEAGIIGEILQFKLTITESLGMKNIYIGEIKSMEEHQKLKANCDTFQEVLELIKD